MKNAWNYAYRNWGLKIKDWALASCCNWFGQNWRPLISSKLPILAQQTHKERCWLHVRLSLLWGNIIQCSDTEGPLASWSSILNATGGGGGRRYNPRYNKSLVNIAIAYTWKECGLDIIPDIRLLPHEIVHYTIDQRCSISLQAPMTKNAIVLSNS